VQIDDPPKVLEKKPLTKEDLRKAQVEEALREAKTLYAIAVIRQRHEKLLQAITALENAAALDSESLELRRALVPLYGMVGREDEAMKLCREVLDGNPHDGEIAFQFAKLLKADGRPAEAIPILQKAVALKEAQDRPERLLFMLSDLYELLDKKNEHAEAAKVQEAIIHTITEKREQLLFGHGFLREDLEASLARAYERLGRARVQLKQYEKAVLAFRGARATLLKIDDPNSRHQAVRISWNLSEMAAAQEKWGEAMEALDDYLEHSPGEIEPYEKKIELLRKLGRDSDVVPVIRRYAGREEFHLGLQLLLARELAKEPRSRREAEQLYQALLKKNIKPEIYRGLFNLYAADKRMTVALDLLDGAVRKSDPEENAAKVEERELAQEQMRAMVSVLRSDSALVAAVLPAALSEAGADEKRHFRTWGMLAELATRSREFDRAEKFFEACVESSAANEYVAYRGLLYVLARQHKNERIVVVCEEVLSGKRRLRIQANQLFHSAIAGALAELGKVDEALKHADKAIELSSEDHKVDEHQHKSALLAQAGRYDEAISECLKTMDKFPQAERVRAMRYALSNAYSLKGDHDKSEEQLRLVLESEPYAALANNNLGYQMADRNVNLDEAETLIRRAIDADRSVRKAAGETEANAAYLDSLGWVLFRKGKLTDAREWLEKAAALHDGADDPAVWDHLGDVYAKLALPAKAKEAWSKSLKLYEGSGKRKADARRTEVEKKLKTLE
jgi:tetratricopeptide (TPR) repeat protein